LKKISVRVYALIAAVIIMVIAMIADHKITTSYNQSVVEDVQINLREIEALVKNEYDSYRDDIYFLYDTPPISGLTRAAKNNGIDPLDGTTIAQWRSRLTQIFRSFTENNSQYFQLRLLDAQGNETVRVERRLGKIFAVETSDLQAKGDRYYFTSTKTLSKQQLFVSHIDLNHEYGQIAFPHQPTLRTGLPVFSENQFFGQLIANIDVSELLSELDVLVGEYLTIILTDENQYFVKHPDKSLQFSRDLAPEKTFNSEYEVIASEIAELNRYVQKGAGQSALGLSRDIFVSAGKTGFLHAYVLVNEEHYQNQLAERRLESMAGLGAVLLVSLLAFRYLGANNHRLSKLLIAAEEAKAAVDVAEDAVITVNHEWHITSYNQAFVHMFLLQKQEIRGQKITELLVQIGGEEVAEVLLSRLGTGVNGVEWQQQIQGGRSMWFHCKVNIIDNPQAEAAYAIVIRDITAEKESLLMVAENNQKLEKQVADRTEELRKSRDEAVELSQLKSNFISTISHEMRTPLNGIVGATTLLRSESLNAKQAKLLDMAQSSVDTLQRLINDVLDLSKIEAGKLELNFRNFNPEALIEGITSTMSVVANQKGIGFYIDTSQLNFSLIHSDPHRLTQVINNVLNNAIKFTSEGYVLLTCRGEGEDNEARLVIEVTDTGKGVESDQIDKLFTAFNQADKTIAASYGGTGLGLSICREILTLLNGSITVTSEEGAGATFTITVPLKLWQVREEDKSRLAGACAGMMVSSEPLDKVLQQLLVCNGASPVVYHRPMSLAEVQSCDYLFVEQGSAYYSVFAEHWRQWVENAERLPSLFVISQSAADESTRLEQATVLTEPLYRSVFLSNVVDSRVKRHSSSSLPTDGRRSSDVPEGVSEGGVVLSRKRILIVDDNEINRQVAEFILEPYGATVIHAVNGEEAIRCLLDDQRIDLVLMDCNMPVMNGYDATRAIRQGQAGKKYAATPIIAMTANALKGESDKCYDAGMNEYLTKPIDATEFIQKVQSCLEPDKIENVQDAANDCPVQSGWQQEQALTRLDNNKALMKKLLTLYINESQPKLAAIEKAIVAEDRETLRFTAHALKGNSADVGATSLSDLLAKLEEQAQTATQNEMAQLFATIAQQMPLLLTEFEHFIKEN